MEEFVNGLIKALVNVFDMYIVYRYMTIFFGNKFTSKKLVVGAYVTRFILLFVFGAIEVLPIVSSCVYFVCIFMIAIFYKARLLKKLVVSILVIMCGFVGEVLVALCIGLSDFDWFGQMAQASVFYEVIMELIFWAMTLVVQRFQNVNSNVSVPKVFLVAIVIIPLSSICLEIMIFQQDNFDSNMASVSLLCIVTINFILIYLYDSLFKLFQERTRAAIVMREKEYYHEQAEVLKIQYEELKEFRHDFKNRMVVIEQLINENKYNRLLDYTKLITEKLEKTNVYSSSGKLAIDSVMNYKLSRAVESGVDVQCEVIIPETLRVDEDDIVVILGNLLDNALEATLRLVDNRYIYVDIQYDKGTLLIHVENTYDSVVYQDKGKLLTRKEDINLHGIGLQSVNTVVEKYNGKVDIEKDKDKFVVDVMLYL